MQRDLSSPIYSFITRLNQDLFRGTTYANDPLGTSASFDKATGARLKDYYKKWYAPNNAILVVSGDDALTLPQIACGMEGIISVAANSFPRQFTDMVRLCLKGDFKAAKALNDKLIQGYELLFAENNPAGVKAAMSELKLIGNHLRLPVVPVSEGLQQKINIYVKNLK